jgi:predicted nucleotidyltransferase
MLTENQKKIIVQTMLPFKPEKIGVFGSVARNENSENSDIDILFSFNSTYTLFDLSGLKLKLQELLKKKVDLVEFSAIHRNLRNQILKDSIIFYGE